METNLGLPVLNPIDALPNIWEELTEIDPEIRVLILIQDPRTRENNPSFWGGICNLNNEEKEQIADLLINNDNDT